MEAIRDMHRDGAVGATHGDPHAAYGQLIGVSVAEV